MRPLNPALQKVQYALRGELAIKAEVLRDKLKEPNHGLHFDKVISSNIGNPQQKGLEVLAFIYKIGSVALCTPLAGQIGVDSMVRPPKPGQESYELWKKETDTIHAALASRTQIMAARLNALPGVSCVDSPGALYLFPRIILSQKAQEAARKAGKEPDVFYALSLLDETGICVAPGSGFGQKQGEWHYRLTCLCPGVDEYIGRLEKFHQGFVERYGLQ